MFRFYVSVWRTCRDPIIGMAVGPLMGAAARRSWSQDIIAAAMVTP